MRYKERKYKYLTRTDRDYLYNLLLQHERSICDNDQKALTKIYHGHLKNLLVDNDEFFTQYSDRTNHIIPRTEEKKEDK